MPQSDPLNVNESVSSSAQCRCNWESMCVCVCECVASKELSTKHRDALIGKCWPCLLCELPGAAAAAT